MVQANVMSRTEPRQSELSAAMSELIEVLDAVTQQQARVEERLRPLLRPAPPVAVEKGSAEMAARVLEHRQSDLLRDLEV
jgi:hypothetical protein